MSGPPRAQQVEMIAIDAIDVLNPRARNRRRHREIVGNIEAVGLKRPITVSRQPSPGRYNLVCGEGRIEAYQMLGATEIPALVIDADEADCLIMSLVENVARPRHRPIDVMREIGSLYRRGYSDAAIARKVGVTEGWVSTVGVLLDRGEEKLVAAVETGLMPVSLAIEIARAESSEVQDLLTEAYVAGDIKRKRLAALRRLLDTRARQMALAVGTAATKPAAPRDLGRELVRVYQEEAEKQRLLVKKAEVAQATLLFIVEAVRDLLAADAFAALLRSEGLLTMPHALAARVTGATRQ